MEKRLSWNIYFLRIAREVSKNSKCLSRKIGAILVKDKAIISTGYNGPARGVKHCEERDKSFYKFLDTGKSEIFELDTFNKCPRKELGYKSGQGLHLCQAGHAERNALIQAARNGISTLNTTLYCTDSPCKECAIEMVNAGVKKLVYPQNKDYDEYSKVILLESKISKIEIIEVGE